MLQVKMLLQLTAIILGVGHFAQAQTPISFFNYDTKTVFRTTEGGETACWSTASGVKPCGKESRRSLIEDAIVAANEEIVPAKAEEVEEEAPLISPSMNSRGARFAILPFIQFGTTITKDVPADMKTVLFEEGACFPSDFIAALGAEHSCALFGKNNKNNTEGATTRNGDPATLRIQKPIAKRPKENIVYSDSCKCGVVNESDEEFPGSQVAPNTYPWQVAIRFGEKGVLCGGTIISDQIILTAAHCTADEPKSTTVVLLAEHNIESQGDGSFEIGIEEIIHHPRFDRNTFVYDVSLIRLKKAIIFNEKVRPACLPLGRNKEYEDETGVVTGWQLLKAKQEKRVARNLHKTEAQVVGKGDCRSYQQFFNDNTMMCVKTQNINGFCKADDGGPLVIKGQKGKYEVAGSFLFGANCDDGQLFNKIAPLLPWIKGYLGGTKVCKR